MTQEESKFKRIRASEVGSVSGWELPEMSSPVAVPLQRKPSEDTTRVTEEEHSGGRVTLSEMEAIRENARLEGLAAGLEEGRAQGYQEGHDQGVEQGREQGYSDGLDQGKEETERLQQQLTAMIGQLAEPVGTQQSTLETLLLNLVLKLSRTVVGHELSTRPGLLAEAIRDALEHIPEPVAQVELTLHPDDVEKIRPFSDHLSSGLQLLSDDAVTAGGFRLKTVNSLVLQEVEEQFRQVADQLLSNLQQASSDPDEITD